MASVDRPDEAKVVVDPNALDATGGTSIDWYVPSFDGRKLAVSLAKGGSERGDAHVYEVDTGRALPDVVTRVNYGTAGGSLAWDAQGEGFFYTRYPRPGERPEADLDFYTQVYYHRLGTPEAQDRYEIGKDFPRIAEIDLRARADGRYLLANVQNGDGGEFEQHLRRPDGSWTRLSRFEDRVLEAVFDPADDSLLLLSRQGAPRGRLMKLPLRASGPLEAARPFLAEGEAVIEPSFSFDPSSKIVATGKHLYLVEQVGGPQRVRVLDRADLEPSVVPLPEASAVYQIVPEPGRDALLVQSASYVEPSAWYRFEPGAAGAAGRLTKTALAVEFPISLRDAAVSREWATSKDGTRVPLTVIAPRGAKRDGSNPTLLGGYGGYGISQVPFFDPGLRLWLDRGGVLALANLRGGGEFGEAWHDAGRLLLKQNVFDDFIACAEQLVKSGYTSPKRLAIEGGSNGGLLMGAVLTQRPELFAAVVSHVGIYDMLRVELSPNGAFNVPEFGTVKDDGAVPRALRLLALPPREGRRRLSPGAAAHGRQRPARRPDALAQDGGAAAGGDRGQEPRAAARERRLRPRHRHRARRADRTRGGHARVPVRRARDERPLALDGRAPRLRHRAARGRSPTRRARRAARPAW